MSDVVIRVENLSKKYIIGHQKQERYTALRDVISNGAKSVWQGLTGRSKPNLEEASEDFWALKDVSFEIKQGDRVGIIGHNGAGKSTLLKILSRITEPTSGKISIKGRVASLLEVGTGFHPELTGRENVYLNGAILGMDRVEIKKKFDEIVAFAEVEKFLDTPVKRYSSGMYVRLAFAVAAHLEPEILIVDEVLAVGDSAFQKKCLGKMEDVAEKEGRTVLFVSHNMAAIQQLCEFGILLGQGSLLASGSTAQVISKYVAPSTTLNLYDYKSKFGIQLASIGIKDAEFRESTQVLNFNHDYILSISLKSEDLITKSGLVIKFYNQLGFLVSSICTPEEGIGLFDLKGVSQYDFRLSKLQLMPGQYSISIFVHRANDLQVYFEAENVFDFEVQGFHLQNAMWSYRQDHGIFRLVNTISVSKSHL